MAVIKRADQVLADRYPGVPRHALAGADLAGKELHVGDLEYLPGSSVPYHYHPDAEETQMMLEGELECWFDRKRFTVVAGDCIVAPIGIGHAFFNRSDRSARMVTIFAITPPETVNIDAPELVDGRPDSNVSFADLRPAARTANGITRAELAGASLGSTSCSTTELILEPGAVISNHHHPEHESTMFCVEGELTAVYGDDESIGLGTNDVLTAEAKIRHGLRNESDRVARLISTHPVLVPDTVQVD